ncbi:MAG: hypothetical protein AB8U25_00170 [Rickettsiales endosymbiont of Dermacentor nuttalli]
MKTLADITIERVISNVFTKTSMLQYIKSSVSKKINKVVNFVIVNNATFEGVNVRKLFI